MMDWLSGLVGENAAHIISFIGLFVVFLAGVFVVYTAIKRMTAGTYVTKHHDAAPRLTVTDAAAIDSQRRLVLVRRDDVEHLILIGGPSDIVIEQNITRHQPVAAEQPAPRIRRQEAHYAAPAVAVAAPVAAQAVMPALEPEPAVSVIPADIIAATPAYKPEAEIPAPQPRAAAPAAPAPAQPVAAPAQPLQTHAQQVAAARQQQSQKQAPRPQAPARPAEPAAPKLHPVYPLGQVSRGVIAATSGLAAANNAAQQELIAAAKRDSRSASPSLDDVRPGTNAAEGNPLVSQRATPQIGRPMEPSFSTPAPAAAPAAKPAQQSGFELDLENAVAEALSSKDLTADSEISFEDLLSSEMDQHFATTEKAAQPEKPLGSTLDISPRK